jgi:hypothetical protein
MTTFQATALMPLGFIEVLPAVVENEKGDKGYYQQESADCRSRYRNPGAHVLPEHHTSRTRSWNRAGKPVTPTVRLDDFHLPALLCRHMAEYCGGKRLPGPE